MSTAAIQLIVGSTSALLVATLNIPQAVKVYRQGSSDELSMGTLCLHLLSSILWIVYGALLKQLPIALANMVYLAANLFLLGSKLGFVAPHRPSIRPSTF